MATLTIALIVKNEAVNLPDCLESCLGLADELVVVDGGSTDGTVEVAQRFGANVICKPTWEGFGKQRQFAQAHVTTDWVFWIDADERITPELKTAIERVLRHPEPTSQTNTIYSVARLSWAFGRFIRHSGWYPDRVLRLHPTTLTRYTDAPVHERLMVPANARIEPLAGDLLHYTYKDLHHYLVKSAQYAELWAKARESKGKRSSLLQGVLHGVGCFLRMYVLKAGFLDGKQGFLLAVLSAHSTFAKYADLWVRHTPKPAGR
jgi:(heptosyl)LPS beta-1,4-glucosyltransferase